MAGEESVKTPAPPCTYCGRDTEPVTGKKVYPHIQHEDLWPGKYWLCEYCNAYVGCHADSDIPLGTPANGELRRARTKAHKQFDKLWRGANKSPRKQIYESLAHHLGIPTEKCHIGMFDLKQCKMTEDWSRDKALLRQVRSIKKNHEPRRGRKRKQW